MIQQILQSRRIAVGAIVGVVVVTLGLFLVQNRDTSPASDSSATVEESGVESAVG